MDEHRLIPDRLGYTKKFLGERAHITWLLLKDRELTDTLVPGALKEDAISDLLLMPDPQIVTVG